MTLNSGADTRKITLGRVILGVLGAGSVFFAAIQLVPVKRDNPPVVSEPNWDSPQTRALAQRACFDCHSNETVWPWYAHVAPASWLAAHDVHEGRGILNFSEWNHPQPGADEVQEVIEEREMPPSYFLIMHPEARLTPEERDALAKGLDASVGPR
jgi:mono/diheme cytochrome c family protein